MTTWLMLSLVMGGGIVVVIRAWISYRIALRHERVRSERLAEAIRQTSADERRQILRGHLTATAEEIGLVEQPGQTDLGASLVRIWASVVYVTVKVLGLAQAGSADLLTTLAALVGGKSRSWRVTEWQADLAESSKSPKYAAGLVKAALKMRLSGVIKLAVRGLCWVLCSEVRTWTPLSVVLVWGGIDTAWDTGLGAAIGYVLMGIAGLAASIYALRRRWGIDMKRKASRDADKT